ncbi:TetR-like C-terminal domain-containing protein [Secundilactobacillus collinoides]|uniref:TetR-like C-terminal domain-containing protein n=1 Tax=Secundilactobacillus collinoides TaxID=33960 RepID=UPI000B1F8C34|nr:TetR-like C-terminal domain-containing protein [Secundilactobacillus collinoides]
MKTLIDQHLFNLVFEQVQSELVSTYLSLSFSWHQVTNDNEIRLLMQFMLGGITEIIQDWLSVPNPESPVGITEKFQKIIRDIQILPN